MSISVKPKHASIDLNLIDESRLEKVIKKKREGSEVFKHCNV